MIMALTAEQKARFPEFIEKWTKVGLCTDPANRPAAEEGVRLAYRTAGLEPPRIVWCGSPLSMVIAGRDVQDSDPLGTPVLGIAYPVSHLINNSARNSAWAAIADSGLPSVFSSVVTSLSDSITISVRSIGNLIRNSLEHAAPGPCVYASIWGQHNASWYAFYDYFRVVCGFFKQTDKMLGVTQVAENAGWWMPYKDICWISERPNRLKLDDRGRIHCEDGPTLSYPDGFSFYAIHGVLLDEQTILRPRSQNVDVIRNERNAEVKRIRIERFGWAEYLREVGAVVIDTRDNEVEATKEALMKTPDGHTVLVCSCPSTGRVYSLEVPPGIMTCEAAQDWLSGGLSNRVINGA